MSELVAILRDAALRAAPQDEVGDNPRKDPDHALQARTPPSFIERARPALNFRQKNFEGVEQSSYEQPLMPPWIFAGGNQVLKWWEKFQRPPAAPPGSRIAEVEAAHSSCTLVNWSPLLDEGDRGNRRSCGFWRWMMRRPAGRLASLVSLLILGTDAA